MSASSGPLRIFQAVDPYLPTVSGVTLSIEAHTRLLAERGHRVVLAAPAFPGWTREEVEGSRRIVRFRALGLPTYPEFRVGLPQVGKLAALWNELRPDIVHLQTFGPVAALAQRFAKRHGVPVVTSYLTYLPEVGASVSPLSLPSIRRWLPPLPQAGRAALTKLSDAAWKRFSWGFSRWFFNGADVLVTPTEAIREALVRHGLRPPVRAISCGFPLERFPRKPRGRSRGRFLHLGRLGFEKRTDVVLRAMAEVVRSVPSARLSIVGDGPAAPGLRALSRELGIDGAVDFVGHVPPHETPAVYRDHDLFVTGSPMETQGIVLLEAMASGLPVVGVDALAVPELVRPGETGALVEPGDHRAMARALAALVTSDETLERLADGARRAAEAHDQPAVIDSTEALYHEVLATSTRASAAA